MNYITTEKDCIRINEVLIPKNSREVILIKGGVRISNVYTGEKEDLMVKDTYIDGGEAYSEQDIFSFLLLNGFTSKGSDVIPPEPEPLPFIRPKYVRNNSNSNIINSRTADIIVTRTSASEEIFIDFENGNIYAPYEMYLPAGCVLKFINKPMYLTYQNKSGSITNIVDLTQYRPTGSEKLIKVLPQDGIYNMKLLELS